MTQDVQCGRCGRQMHFVTQFQASGVPTFAFHCTGCNGKAHLQQRMNPQTRQPQWVQVQLTGNHNEYRPQSVRPNDQVQIPVAYTLGSSPHAARSHVRMAPLPPPPTAYRLDPSLDQHQIPGLNDPMHPENLRRTMQPIRLEEFGG